MAVSNYHDDNANKIKQIKLIFLRLDLFLGSYDFGVINKIIKKQYDITY
ncbi:MAG: hypothetical protein RIR39_1258 [Pseudomonadota bacterium]|jgi:hypothetical protein